MKTSKKKIFLQHNYFLSSPPLSQIVKMDKSQNVMRHTKEQRESESREKFATDAHRIAMIFRKHFEFVEFWKRQKHIDDQMKQGQSS